MEKFIIGKMKSGTFEAFASMSDLKENIDYVASWLSIKAETAAKAIDKFPEIEEKYGRLYNHDKLKRIIDLGE